MQLLSRVSPELFRKKAISDGRNKGVLAVISSWKKEEEKEEEATRQVMAHHGQEEERKKVW